MVAVALLGACGDDPADEAPGQVTTTAVASQAPTTSSIVAGGSAAAGLTSGRPAAGAVRTTLSVAAPRP